jgi:hypothetical protein
MVVSKYTTVHFSDQKRVGAKYQAVCKRQQNHKNTHATTKTIFGKSPSCQPLLVVEKEANKLWR